MENSPQCKVLCLGDSLTAGYVHQDLHTPYSDYLTTLFKSEGRDNITFFNAGVDGDTTEDILARLPQLLQKVQYQHVIFFAGINDLGEIFFDHTTCTAEEATAHISFNPIYDLFMAEDSIESFLQLTIPYTSFDRLDDHEKDMKDALNNRIKSNSCPKKRVLDLNDPTLDFNHLLMTDDERSKHWEDVLHYTPHGYERLAKCIYAKAKNMIG
ncbi:hypothetical protein BGZ46_006299 [Entomortierella lignicola]|nr:hypothetical protein BGZ46_006299 [Entomortierella lignicola]